MSAVLASSTLFGRLADQLQRAVERGEYAEAARLLEAVQQLAAHFQAFGSVPKVLRALPLSSRLSSPC